MPKIVHKIDTHKNKKSKDNKIIITGNRRHISCKGETFFMKITWA